MNKIVVIAILLLSFSALAGGKKSEVGKKDICTNDSSFIF